MNHLKEINQEKFNLRSNIKYHGINKFHAIQMKRRGIACWNEKNSCNVLMNDDSKKNREKKKKQMAFSRGVFLSSISKTTKKGIALQWSHLITYIPLTLPTSPCLLTEFVALSRAIWHSDLPRPSRISLPNERPINTPEFQRHLVLEIEVKEVLDDRCHRLQEALKPGSPFN